MKHSIAILFILLGGLSQSAAAQELDCFTKSERESASLYSHLQQQAYTALDRRAATYDELKTPEQIRAYQRKLRDFFTRQLGGFPQRTPLNAKTVRTVAGDGYRIENVIFESQPNHHVTANLYLPDTNSPVPGIVVSSGHSRTGKTADYNQRFGIMMAKHGMAALCFDPIGQGERSQILDAEGKPQFNGTTTEHFLIGVGSILVGRNTARYRIWDAMRAIDYLAGRKEVDAKRIGFTGCSGGGTLTSYVMALDDRVACAAPACYLTTFRRLIETIGPQDAEQNIYGQIAFGLDQPDYVLLRAPRPTLISSTSGDFSTSKVVGTITGSQSASTPGLAFPSASIWSKSKDATAFNRRTWPPSRSGCGGGCWVATSRCRSPNSLLASQASCSAQKQARCSPALPASARSSISMPSMNRSSPSNARSFGKKSSDDELRAKIRDLLAVRPNAELKPPKWEDRGRVKRDGYHIDKLVLKTDSGVPLPALTFHPPTPVDAAYLYLHEDGKLGDSAANGPIKKLVGEGYAVVTVDLRGQGETSSGRSDPLLTDWKTYYLGYLLGKPLVGLRSEDALAAADFVAYYQKERDDPREVHLVGVGRAGIVALHAAALHPELFTSVTLRDTPRDWSSLVGKKVPAGQLDSTVHGALEAYDLPDLLRLIGEKKVQLK